MRHFSAPAWLALSLWLGLAAGPAPAENRLLDFADLQGWAQDDHLAALNSFLATCDLLDAAEWRPLCGLAAESATSRAAARAFFELLFRPVQIGAPPALFTGYFEPVLDGARSRSDRYAWPVYRRPPELRDGLIWHDRATIERGILSGRGLEIAWVDDPVAVFLLHIQGSGRIRLDDGSVLRVGYAGRNGHPFVPLGQSLTAGPLSAERLGAILNVNPSYVFFRVLPDLPPEAGPLGAMGRSLRPLRSVAIDPGFVPLGAPVWLETHGPVPMNRLMVAQDTGGAVRGAQRADIFFGTGAAPGRAAGNVRDGGRMLVLLPIDSAYALAAPAGL